ncbi:MAG TPA: solute carrier family 23 protein [Actinomycetota bacterium]|jgi:solute carrier family 23 (nucleobase transporter), member 1|nr:solute carrier family 23 protein [Actinomycetota bacterium]
MAQTATGARGMRYGLDDVPRPFPLAVGLGVQHVLTMFGATIAVPLILGPAMEMTGGEIAILVSSVMICSGLATLVQVSIGTRLPIIQGISFSFLGPFFAIIGATAAQGGRVSMQFIAGAVLAGAVVEMIVGYSGLLGRLRDFVSPVVIGPTIAMIGLALFGVGAPTAAGNWWLALIVVTGVFVFSLIVAPRNRFVGLFPILLAVLVAYAVALVGSLTGIIPEGSPGYVSFAALGEAPWVRNPVDVVFPWGAPQFKAGFILSALAGYLASMIESFGDYHSVAAAAGAPRPSDRQINRGIGAEGIGCFLTGIFGGFASTSYTENIGLVALTRVASRYVVVIAGVLLVVLGFIAKFGALIATIPQPIVGGLYLTLFGLIASIGLGVLRHADLDSQRNQLIIGFSLFMGLSLPAYFNNVEVQVSWAPWLGEMIDSIGSTGMAVSAIIGLLLDNLIPGTRRERGLDTGHEVDVQTEVAEPEGRAWS